MGRRALRPVDPTLDLSRHLRTLDEVPASFQQRDYFDRTAPLEVEIGSGKGLFLHDASAANPDHNFLGIEIARKYARFAAGKLASSERSNAVMIQGDGLRFFREMLPDQCCRAVHVYFPDPWWKKRHRRRRVMNEAFIADIHRVLEMNGTLHFWTDVQEYFETTLGLMAEKSQLAGPFDVEESPAEHDMDYRTHFERRMRRHDLAIFRSQFRRLAE